MKEETSGSESEVGGTSWRAQEELLPQRPAPAGQLGLSPPQGGVLELGHHGGFCFCQAGSSSVRGEREGVMFLKNQDAFVTLYRAVHCRFHVFIHQSNKRSLSRL